MTETTPYTETLHYAPCPWCGKRSDSSIDHLMNQSLATTWYCHECGESFDLKFDGTGKLWVAKVPGRRCNKVLVLLRYGNMGLVVEGKDIVPTAAEQHRYFYEEHTCPTNFVRHIKVVINLKDGDIDPHGIFRFMGTVPYTEKIEDCNLTEDDLAKIIGSDAFALPASSV